MVSLRRLFWLRWALLSAQATMLLTCEALAGVILPYRPLLIIFALQTLFNLMTGLRLHLHSSDDAAPSDAELMGQLMVDLTALSAILFFTGGATNPFVSFYLPGLAIAAAILPWRMVMALALFALACYSVLLLEYVPLNLINPDNAVNYHLAGMWLNFVASAVMIAFFVARLSGVLRQRDAQLSQAQEQLLREARVEALNAQAAAVAHEIGTPLSTLAVIAGELRGDAEHRQHGATPVAGYLADLQTMEQQIELCKSILARLREDHATVAPQAIASWLPAFVERWQLRHPQAQLQASAAPAAAAQEIEPARVGQILTILLDNAARSQQGATPPLQLSIALESGTPHATLCFRVADHGGGIAPLLRQHLGEAPVASSHGGQGIGAYLAQSTALRMGGRLSWHDHAGGGTVAELRLPLAARAAAGA
ncbi:ATP-binding protein [Cupriavidus sp. USMAA2-4]|uniref:histidine kinase n=1 Tax=Cupriavidus malaysiensis TaxID=367825 RepID=A0ABN4TNJ8_9BURK|nr:ATP-binding protein [Cupriavidus sp. USMAA2-4]AOZ01086.1 ATP-binding protein [Cupriavidus sp. USMAHM13]AOZ07914.1 ATP-binding protein [Cupriavidus malaysiensis]